MKRLQRECVMIWRHAMHPHPVLGSRSWVLTEHWTHQETWASGMLTSMRLCSGWQRKLNRWRMWWTWLQMMRRVQRSFSWMQCLHSFRCLEYRTDPKTTQLLRKLNWPVSHRYLVHPSLARQDQFQQAFSKGRAQNVAYAVQNCLQIQSACSWASLARNGPAGTICTMRVWNYWCSQHLHRIFVPCAAQNLST